MRVLAIQLIAGHSTSLLPLEEALPGSSVYTFTQLPTNSNTSLLWIIPGLPFVSFIPESLSGYSLEPCTKRTNYTFLFFWKNSL